MNARISASAIFSRRAVAVSRPGAWCGAVVMGHRLTIRAAADAVTASACQQDRWRSSRRRSRRHRRPSFAGSEEAGAEGEDPEPLGCWRVRRRLTVTALQVPTSLMPCAVGFAGRCVVGEGVKRLAFVGHLLGCRRGA